MSQDLFKKTDSADEVQLQTVYSSQEKENICCLKKLYSSFKKRPCLYLAIFFALVGVIFLISGIMEWVQLEKNIHVDLLTAFGSCFIAATFLYSIDWNIQQKNKEASQFYLSQIQRYFRDAMLHISAADNNNIKWHRGVNCLKSVESLYQYLTDNTHKEVFLRDYIDAGYAIVDIINAIDSPLFFYGVADYKNYIGHPDAHTALYNKSGRSTFDVLRISPDALQFLCAFYDKTNSLFFQDEQGVLNHIVWDRSWFRKIDSAYQINHFTENAPIVKKINEYINNVKKLKKVIA